MIGIVNYGGGNIFSLKAALDRIELEYGMINSATDMDNYSHIIIPGVGHAGKCMERLLKSNMVESILHSTLPTLGICVGMQLLSAFSEEGNCKLLGVVPQKTIAFKDDPSYKIPHMGWNSVFFQQNALFENIKQGSHFYFVHSYYVELDDASTIASAQHGNGFSAALQHKNFYGVQFHPEKSGAAGEQLLKNFSRL